MPPASGENSSDVLKSCGTVGCITLVVVPICVFFQLHPLAWPKWLTWQNQQTLVSGRYQVVTGRVATYDTERKEQPQIIKVDTATGKTWAFLPLEMGNLTNGGELYFQPNRWVEVEDNRPEQQQNKQALTPSPKPN